MSLSGDSGHLDDYLQDLSVVTVTVTPTETATEATGSCVGVL